MLDIKGLVHCEKYFRWGSCKACKLFLHPSKSWFTVHVHVLSIKITSRPSFARPINEYFANK